ncbi:MAG: hypothetical protein ACJATF_001023 [Flavobacteriales bacterium]|jgi:hypothetical protein
MNIKNTLSIMRFSSILLLLFAFVPDFAFAQNESKKINGISIYPPIIDQLTTDMIASVRTCHVDWVAFIPEATIDRETLVFRSEKEMDHLGKSTKGSIEGISIAKSIGLKVLIKPHIEISAPIPVTETVKESSILDYFSYAAKEKTFSKKDKTQGATWRGDFAAANEADWKTWEECYESYMLNWARVADSLSVDMLCVGTELKLFVQQRPRFWQQLIKKIKKIYKGPLTYSANWDEYADVPFWKDLDYIGIDAYFPISDAETPTVAQVVAGWKPIAHELKALSKKYKRQVLITEFGYRNVSYAGKEPWTHDKEKTKSNYEAQVNLYEGFFQTFQQESYISGSFLWQWIVDDQQPWNTSFSPRGKPAMKVLEKWYGGN